MLRFTAVALILMFNASSAAAAARSDEDAKPATLTAAVSRAAKDAAPPPAAVWSERANHRPAPLTALYGTYAALQVFDIVSTRRALAAGAVETNPAMRGGLGASIAVKAASGLSTIYFSERAWKKNRAGAIVLMAALNGATAAIAAHNMRVARR